MFRSTTLRAVHVGLTIAIALVWLAPPAAAQAVYGSIGGTVTDTSGGALPGVTVTITSVERKTVDTAVTNESGFLREGPADPWQLRSQSRTHEFQSGGRSERPRRRRRADARQFQSRGRGS